MHIYLFSFYLDILIIFQKFYKFSINMQKHVAAVIPAHYGGPIAEIVAKQLMEKQLM